MLQFYLGCFYADGRIVKQSDSEAASLLRKVADQGNVQAQCHLGVFYEKGRGVKQSDSEAVSLYRKAADQVDADERPRDSCAVLLGAFNVNT